MVQNKPKTCAKAADGLKMQWNTIPQYNIGCSKKKCKGFLLITPAMEHTERQTRYHLIELNLTDIVVYDF